MSEGHDTERLMAVALAALCLAGIFSWAILSLIAAGALAENVASQRMLLAGLDRRLVALDERRTAAGGEAAGARLSFAGATAAIAGAEFQRRIAAAVEAAGGEIREIQILPADEATAMQEEIGLRVLFVADTAAMQRILFEVETGLPLMLVQNLSIQSEGDAADAAARPMLNVALVVRAVWRNG